VTLRAASQRDLGPAPLSGQGLQRMSERSQGEPLGPLQGVPPDDRRRNWRFPLRGACGHRSGLGNGLLDLGRSGVSEPTVRLEDIHRLFKDAMNEIPESERIQRERLFGGIRLLPAKRIAPCEADRVAQ
jgi:hypothetical protein